MVHQFPLEISSWWVDPPSSIHPLFVPAVALNICRLVPWWFFPHRPNRPSYQQTRAPQILCQLQLVCLDHSGPSVRKLWSLWGTKLSPSTWHPVSKAPLQKGGQRNTNFSNMFPCLFELQPLSHFEMIHKQHWNNLHTNCAGRSEDGPRGLVWKR